MQDTPQDGWFYTREGERLGPVTLVELRTKAQEGGLNPRLDLVWTEGMADWKPAGEIEGLFERRTVVAPPPLTAGSPMLPPDEESLEDAMSQSADWPGARRRGFLIATMIFPGLWNFVLTSSTDWLTAQFGPRIMGPLAIAAACVPVVVVVHYGLKRLINLGMSRWWYLANFVPGLNLWLGYRCVACPSGYAYHKKLDAAGVFLAILYWLLVALVLCAVAAVAAMFCGIPCPSVLPETMRDTVRVLIESSAKP